ncbi:MAG: hypothetical protein ABSG43_08665 [Solirubrobacteraceae bacterium]
MLDDGGALAESNAILSYFADGTEYLPADRFERVQVLQWLLFEQYSHEPFIAVARFWATRRSRRQSASSRPSSAAAGSRSLDRHLSQRQFLVAERYAIADIALYAYTHVAPKGGFTLEHERLGPRSEQPRPPAPPEASGAGRWWRGGTPARRHPSRTTTGTGPAAPPNQRTGRGRARLKVPPDVTPTCHP